MPKCSSSGGWRLDPRPLARFLLLALSTLDGNGLWWDRGIRALAEARKLPDIHWHSNNSIFDISNTEHVKRVQLMDRVTLLCPPPEADGDPASRYEHTKLFMVSRDAYQQCALHGDERQLGVCSTPERQSSITLVFRQFSPLPSAFTFRPGHSYFVITTSNGSMSGLNSTRGGLCSTRNMRLKFDILPSESDENESAQALEQHRHHGHSHSHGRLPPHHRKSSRREPEEQQQLEASQEEMAAAANDGHPPFLYVIHTADTPLGEEGEEDEQQQSAAWEQRVEGRGSRQRHLAAQASSSLRHFPSSAISVLPVLSLLAALFELGRLLGPQ